MPTIAHVTLSADCVEAIKLITKVDFQNTQCVPSAQAYTLAKKIRNFLTVRNRDEYTKFMSYYNLEELIESNALLTQIADEFADAHQHDCGVVVILQ
jgi:hypothetical protein